MKVKSKNNHGITLIALVVTIIVLLILAGISISMLTGQNGILKRVAQAKEEDIIAKEQEYIKMAYMSAMTKNLENKVTDKQLQQELDELISEQTVVTTNDDGTLNVFYKKTKHSYKVDNGNITRDTKNANIKIGDYVDYKPDVAEDYIVSGIASGTYSDQTIEQDNLKWQILNIGDGYVDLISSTPTRS